MISTCDRALSGPLKSSLKLYNLQSEAPKNLNPFAGKAVIDPAGNWLYVLCPSGLGCYFCPSGLVAGEDGFWFSQDFCWGKEILAVMGQRGGTAELAVNTVVVTGMVEPPITPGTA